MKFPLSHFILVLDITIGDLPLTQPNVNIFCSAECNYKMMTYFVNLKFKVFKTISGFWPELVNLKPVADTDKEKKYFEA